MRAASCELLARMRSMDPLKDVAAAHTYRGCTNSSKCVRRRRLAVAALICTFETPPPMSREASARHATTRLGRSTQPTYLPAKSLYTCIGASDNSM